MISNIFDLGNCLVLGLADTFLEDQLLSSVCCDWHGIHRIPMDIACFGGDASAFVGSSAAGLAVRGH